ncbi:tetratricopeptide repeat protein [Planctomicrobium sp. SH661]|uniref:tetratricopeptide repeat protein n=1 Tax=Planctomicrobium sp. SH661 TaxID=3448124 RepID=UPI003F5B0019
MNRVGSEIWILCALAALTFLAYHGVIQNDFVNFDDDRYITQNLIIRHGLTLECIRYAFTTFDTGNWIPLTWLSLGLDASTGSVSPLPFHLTNLLLHGVNVCLLYLLLRRFDLGREASAVVAAIFAVHPLHVESVAWASERKDVLSTSLLLITVWLYQNYSMQPTRTRFLWVAVAFTLGLMAKPMLVTLPLLLILLDIFPLQRWNGRLTEMSSTLNGGHSQPGLHAIRLVQEKWSLFLIAFVFGVVTILAQRNDRAIANVEVVPVLFRLANSLHATAWYIGKTFWPIDLCIFYPLSADSLNGWRVLAAGLLLAGITLISVAMRKRQPWLFTGWLWFLISLLPVIGLLQVGSQSHADRYSYIPHIGLLIMLVCGWEATAVSLRFPAILRWLTAGIAVAALTVLCMAQVKTWQNSRTLWTHSLAVVPGNWMAHFQLGREDVQQQDWKSARQHAEAAIQSNPRIDLPYSLLGRVEQSHGRWRQAEEAHRYALQLAPKNRDSLIGLAAVEHARGNVNSAVALLQERLNTSPRDVYARMQLGLIHAEGRQTEQALEQLDAVLRLDPTNAEACRQAGWVLAREGELERAIPYFERALQINPQDAESRNALERFR